MLKRFILSMILLPFSLYAFDPIYIDMETAKGKKLKMRIDSNGLKVTNRWKNKALLLVFFGTHCPACNAEMPELKKIHKQTRDLIVLGIQTEDRVSDRRLQEFAKEMGLNYPVVNFSYSMELMSFVQEHLGWQGEIPKIFLFDRSGKFQKVYTGALSKRRLISDLSYIRYSKRK